MQNLYSPPGLSYSAFLLSSSEKLQEEAEEERNEALWNLLYHNEREGG